MNEAPLADIVVHLDTLLRVPSTPDYPQALNGLQVDHHGPVRRIAAAVDCSAYTIEAAIDAEANLLVVHHGLFWGGLQALTGSFQRRVRLLLEHDIALYSAHLPLDMHELYGNSLLLARTIGLEPTAGFARFQSIDCGVRGEADVATGDLVARLRAFSEAHGGNAVVSRMGPERRTRRWAICSGAGASVETIREAVALGVDTLVVGEGPHWSAVDAPEKGLVIIYAGHYATETLGVRALVGDLGARFTLPWSFIAAPTGL